MSAESALLQGRAMAESLMTDRVEILRVVGVEVDPLTGEDTPAHKVVYSGVGKITSYEAHEASREVILHSSVVQRMSVHIPVGSYRSSVGDVVRIIESRMDPMLEGREFRITQEAPYRSYSTAYRIFIDFKAE